MAEDQYPLENQFDIIHVIDMGHLVFIDKDEKSGILLYECPRRPASKPSRSKTKKASLNRHL